MNKDKLHFLSPLFLKYQADFEKNPRSRVFAPLAESYRKVGMTDKALEVLSQGIRYNPGYIMGYVGLAFCYYDLKQFNLAYSTLRPLVESNRDNIRLQKLFADICLSLDYKDEALETFKYLLFINPKDKEVAKYVETLEVEIEEKYKPNYSPIIIPAENLSDNGLAENSLFDVNRLESSPKIDFDDWLQVNMNDKKVEESRNEEWKVNQSNINLDFSEKVEVAAPIEIEELGDESEDFAEAPVEEVPFVTHTLVDLYCGQGHIEKAVEILEKILLLNPNDKKTLEKLIEIKSLIIQEEKSVEAIEVSKPTSTLVNIDDLDNVSEEEGRRNLMNILDEKVLSQNVEVAKLDKVEVVEKKFSLFLKKIQQRALVYQNRF